MSKSSAHQRARSMQGTGVVRILWDLRYSAHNIIKMTFISEKCTSVSIALPQYGDNFPVGITRNCCEKAVTNKVSSHEKFQNVQSKPDTQCFARYHASRSGSLIFAPHMCTKGNVVNCVEIWAWWWIVLVCMCVGRGWLWVGGWVGGEGGLPLNCSTLHIFVCSC